MKAARKPACLVISMAILLSLTACGDSVQTSDGAEAASETETASERMASETEAASELPASETETVSELPASEEETDSDIPTSEEETVSQSPAAEPDSSEPDEAGAQMGPGGFNGGDGGRGGIIGGMVENDSEIQAVLDENADKFEQFTFEDAEAGVTFEYSLYIPENYDSSQQYPLLLFIPDSTGTGKTAKELVQQYYGATVWATEEEQAKHPSFVLVPAYTKTAASDDATVSEEVKATVTLLEQLQETYSIDADRLYTTGQSGGCMCSFYFNATYPDLFAASMYVSGQWDIAVLQVLENQPFFYITAGGDEKASGGQDEVIAMFDADGAAYSFGTWNAQDSAETQSAAVAELLSLGLDANMIRFETGTVFKEGETGMEHMASFNYGYRLTAVRDWLFEQTK